DVARDLRREGRVLGAHIGVVGRNQEAADSPPLAAEIAAPAEGGEKRRHEEDCSEPSSWFGLTHRRGRIGFLTWPAWLNGNRQARRSLTIFDGRQWKIRRLRVRRKINPILLSLGGPAQNRQLLSIPEHGRPP